MCGAVLGGELQTCCLGQEQLIGVQVLLIVGSDGGGDIGAGAAKLRGGGGVHVCM